MSGLKVLIAGHDWGGLNVLVPLLRAWSQTSDIEPKFLAAPMVRRDIAHRVPELAFAPLCDELTEWLCHRPRELDVYLHRILETGDYDAVVCGTSAHALLERRLFLAADSHGVPSAALCDMWWAYSERFYDGETWTLPDQLWVIDEPMHEAASAVAWPKAMPIVVVGSPLFEELAKRRQRACAGDARAVRFISEPVSTKFPEMRIDEFEIAELLLDALRRVDRACPLVIRPHPADAMETWRHWAYARRDVGVEMETLPMDAAMADTRVAVGISSILLAEMRMCGIPVASIQPPAVDISYYCLPFEDLGIDRIDGGARLAGWLENPGDSRPPPAARHHLEAIAAATRSLQNLACRA